MPFLETNLNGICNFSKVKATALEAPPVPKINAFVWSLFNRGAKDFSNPKASVLNPFKYVPSIILTQLTAPIFCATTSISSRYGIISSLYGIVILKPSNCCMLFAKKYSDIDMVNFHYETSL